MRTIEVRIYREKADTNINTVVGLISHWEVDIRTIE